MRAPTQELLNRAYRLHWRALRSKTNKEGEWKVRLDASIGTRINRSNKGFARIPIVPREAACIMILRSRFQYSIQSIAKAFSRSTATVHRILNFNIDIGALRRFDMRKLPARIKHLQNARHDRVLCAYMDRWVAWICASEGKPP